MTTLQQGSRARLRGGYRIVAIVGRGSHHRGQIGATERRIDRTGSLSA